jgi:hypothetical protein
VHWDELWFSGFEVGIYPNFQMCVARI